MTTLLSHGDRHMRGPAKGGSVTFLTREGTRRRACGGTWREPARPTWWSDSEWIFFSASIGRTHLSGSRVQGKSSRSLRRLLSAEVEEGSRRRYLAVHLSSPALIERVCVDSNGGSSPYRRRFRSLAPAIKASKPTVRRIAVNGELRHQWASLPAEFTATVADGTRYWADNETGHQRKKKYPIALDWAHAATVCLSRVPAAGGEGLWFSQPEAWSRQQYVTAIRHDWERCGLSRFDGCYRLRCKRAWVDAERMGV